MRFLSRFSVPAIMLSIFIGGCATPDTPNKSNYERLMSEAQAEFDKSVMMKQAWLTAETALEKAKEAAAAADWATAMKQAKKAKEHSELAQAQAATEANTTANFLE